MPPDSSRLFLKHRQDTTHYNMALHQSVFVPAADVVGIAVSQNGLLYTTYSPGQPAIFKVTDKKVVSVFAPCFPSAPFAIEKYIVINPGLGQWSNKIGFVYVTQGADIFEITPSSSTRSEEHTSELQS